MTTATPGIATPGIDDDIWRDVWDEEQAWKAESQEEEGAPEPLALVIFGATGDLSHRKLLPALYHLYTNGLLPEALTLIGYGRSRLSDEDFRQSVRSALAKGGIELNDQWDHFSEGISYLSGSYDDLDGFRRLSERLEERGKEGKTAHHHLFYLATPPNTYGDVVRGLGEAGLNVSTSPGGWSRIIVEKPFGRDLETARALNTAVHASFDESQVFRIDHYLGKETVQNILVLRFINGIFESLWNNRYVDHVQITGAETLGVEGRGGYYEEAGAIRDMLQSHLLQLLTLTAMEPPSRFSADKVRDEKVKVLDALRLAEPKHIEQCVVRGQYAAGAVDGEEVPAYRDEGGVDPASTTETYVAAKLFVDNWRWAGVPFYLRTGKRLPKGVSEIAIQFKRAPHSFLGENETVRPSYNVLVLRIQPDEGLALRIDVKIPGLGMRVRPVDMSFLYKETFGSTSPDAYQRLLLDAMRGDSTLFARTDEVETAWALVTKILDSWQDSAQPLPLYPAGSWGPAEADTLLARDGHRWRRP